MRKYLLLLSFTTMLSPVVCANEIVVLESKNNNLALSIYNQDLALVKDTRSANLIAGVSDIVFDGVAEKIQPETAIIYGQDIKVMEQNYSYDLMTNNNMIDKAVGQEVMTVRENPKNGENIFEKAILIGSTYGQPILKFSYGIESNFPGRIVFNKVPVGVSNKPTLTAKVKNQKAGNKNLHMAYLTSGMSWKTDYVAKVVDNNLLDLTGWVSINNESGTDYNNAKIQLVAGDVNIVKNTFSQPKMMMARASFDAVNMAEGSIAPEQVSSYELYTLPNLATLKNKQTKQISLLERKAVKFQKEFNLNSPLYFGGDNEFKKLNPTITYVMENNAKSNLGLSLPQGIIRFYENDRNGNLQFIGSDRISNTAKEETIRLNLGKAFNIVASGKILKAKEKEISRIPNNRCFKVSVQKTYDVEIEVQNSENENQNVVISQYFPDTYKIIKESVKGVEKNSTTRNWTLPIAANDKNKLTYQVEITSDNRICD